MSATRIGDPARHPIFGPLNIALVLILLGLTYGLMRIAWRIRQLIRL